MQTIPLLPASYDPQLPRARDPFERRRERPVPVRLWPGAWPREAEPPRRARRVGWKTWLLVDGTGLALFLAAIVVWPPLDACRTRAHRVGLYAGDTVEKCTRRGVAARIDRADQRLKMLIRGSGR